MISLHPTWITFGSLVTSCAPSLKELDWSCPLKACLIRTYRWTWRREPDGTTQWMEDLFRSWRLRLTEEKWVKERHSSLNLASSWTISTESSLLFRSVVLCMRKILCYARIKRCWWLKLINWLQSSILCWCHGIKTRHHLEPLPRLSTSLKCSFSSLQQISFSASRSMPWSTCTCSPSCHDSFTWRIPHWMMSTNNSNLKTGIRIFIDGTMRSGHAPSWMMEKRSYQSRPLKIGWGNLHLCHSVESRPCAYQPSSDL